MDEDLLKEVTAFETRLGLPGGFYDSLLKSDDWSFVVKLNALFEAACTEALVVRLGCPEIADNLARLDFADNRKGKVRLCFELNIITDEQRLALNDLAELRNDLVHKVENVNFSLTQYAEKLSKGKQETLVKRWGRNLNDTLSFGDVTVTKSAFVLENLKLVLWMSCADILACLHLEFEKAEWRERQRSLDGYRAILAEIQSLSAANQPPSAGETYGSDDRPLGLLSAFLKMQSKD